MLPEEEEEPSLDEEGDVPMGFVDLMLHALVHVFCGAAAFKKFYTRHYFKQNAKSKPY